MSIQHRSTDTSCSLGWGRPGFVFATLAVEDPALLNAINEGEVAGPFGATILGRVLMIPQVPLANVVMVGGLAWMGFELFTARLRRPMTVSGEGAADRTSSKQVALR